jgi:hypothetical protein
MKEASREELEAERTKLTTEIETFKFPCPDCGKHVGRIPWNEENGGECPHCLAIIEPKDFKPFIGELNSKFNRRIELATLITQASMREHVSNLRESLDSWETFLARGCRTEDFDKKLYKMLMSTFYHIAHTDKNGFYVAQFGSLKHTVLTLERMKKFVCNKERSDKESPMAKLEDEIVKIIDESGALPKLEKQLDEETRRTEMAELFRLQAKYGTRK